jgi:hypothetical protein
VGPTGQQIDKATFVPVATTTLLTVMGLEQENNETFQCWFAEPLGKVILVEAVFLCSGNDVGPTGQQIDKAIFVPVATTTLLTVMGLEQENNETCSMLVCRATG